MEARLTNPAMLLPEAMKALLTLAAEHGGLPPATVNLVNLRVSQINGCSVCLEGHARIMKKAGESDERIYTVGGWRDAPYFSDAERAALALTEAVTRVADRPDPMPDEIWNEAARHYDERALGAQLIQIGVINVFNRLNVATRQVAEAWKP